MLRKSLAAWFGNTAPTVVNECRRCGQTVGPDATECPHCGPESEIVEYRVD